MADGIEVSHVAWCVTGNQGFGERFVTNDAGRLVVQGDAKARERFQGNVTVERTG